MGAPISWRPTGSSSNVDVDEESPFPVQLINPRVAGYGLSISQTPIVTAGAYSALDAVGGMLVFANAARYAGGAIIVHSVSILDLAKVSAALTLVLFDRPFTPTADNGVFDPSDADAGNCLGVIPVAAADYSAFNDWGIATVRALGFGPFNLQGTHLFGQLFLPAGSAPTYASVSDVKITLGIVQVD